VKHLYEEWVKKRDLLQVVLWNETERELVRRACDTYLHKSV